MSEMAADIEDLVEEFALLDDWEARYRHVIELGKALAPLAEAERSDANQVRGCASQVWLVADDDAGPPPRLRFRGDSDAFIVRGLIAILVRLLSDRPAEEIAAADVASALARLGLAEHLSPQRANGLNAMVERMQAIAAAQASSASP